MELCSMIAMYLPGVGDRGHLSALRRMHANGFRHVDLCLCSLRKPQSEFWKEDWEERLEEIIQEAARLGMDFPQVHMPQPQCIYLQKQDDPLGENSPHFREIFERGMEIARRCHVKCAVIHPLQTISPQPDDREANIAYNHAFYDRYIEEGAGFGMRFAYENLCDWPQYGRRFCAAPGDLRALVESYPTGTVGVCWDFGHGYRMYKENHLAGLEQVQHLLLATHVDDNVGHEDLHMPPFQGKIDWPAVMAYLRKIDYQGAFTLEIKFVARYPEALKDRAGQLMHDIGQYLLDLA